MKHLKNDAFILKFLCFFPFCISLSSSINSDGLSLLALKASITEDPTKALISWSDLDSNPCNWAGITCDNAHHKVTSISLSSKNLTGYIPSEIGTLTFLTFLDLSLNSFGGPLPHQITALQNLTHLDISSNNFNGSLPETLGGLKHLTGTLNFSYNSFSGEIPASFGRFPVMVNLDLRHNNLTGKIPQVGSLLNQGPTAFSENPYLCGFPLKNPCTEPEAKSPRFLENPQKPVNSGISSNGFAEKRKIKSGLVTISVICGVSVVIGVVFVSAWVIKRKWEKMEEGKMGREDLSVGREEGQKGKFVVVDEGFGLELEDLLRASAYVLGKSRSGIVYKVVVCGGKGVGGPAVVAVRRLSEGDATWRFKEFEVEVEAIGRVQHPNIVRMKAYYYASDEKLLISEFIGNGSLHNALHGPVNNSSPLSWAARLRIIQGAAKGLMHIHECSHRRYVHGNIKSSKILLDGDLKPYISGFGLSRLVQATSIPSTVDYLAPEARDASSKFTQKCDVYSFGVVLLEILTGRLPDGEGLEGLVRKVFRGGRPLSEIIDPALLHEVQAKKQVVATFHIALNCTELDPEMRPRMRTVCDNLDCV
ncbi:hypothetical protein DH2020_013907 [Rehmannia glutinosa]|uniref:Protein kinase domain-containing protein n=1 Tax=Rehmannia glutinosa TaxID=99300 RepID=A0ABR0WY12_REHGL